MRVRAVAIIIRENKVLVIHRQRDNLDYYVLPGGGVKVGETPEQACIREVEEETRLRAQAPLQIFQLLNNENPEYYFLIRSFFGTAEVGNFKKSSPNNTYALEWIERSDIHTINLQPSILKEVIKSVNE
jgi:8-oxo-dGTP diphosphatase